MTILPLDTDTLRWISGLPAESALRQTATFLADLVKDPAFVESEILPCLEEAKNGEDWYVARHRDAEYGSFSLQAFVWPGSGAGSTTSPPGEPTARLRGPCSKCATSDSTTAPYPPTPASRRPGN